jgi:hypothetical protein
MPARAVLESHVTKPVAPEAPRLLLAALTERERREMGRSMPAGAAHRERWHFGQKR